MPDELNNDERLAIKRVQAHMRHLFRFERDWKLLLDWLAYVVQTRKRVSWMPIIQGTEGDGKTFFAEMLKHPRMGERRHRARRSSRRALQSLHGRRVARLLRGSAAARPQPL
jgi:hypothetical protein